MSGAMRMEQPDWRTEQREFLVKWKAPYDIKVIYSLAYMLLCIILDYIDFVIVFFPYENSFSFSVLWPIFCSFTFFLLLPFYFVFCEKDKKQLKCDLISSYWIV